MVLLISSVNLGKINYFVFNVISFNFVNKSNTITDRTKQK